MLNFPEMRLPNSTFVHAWILVQPICIIHSTAPGPAGQPQPSQPQPPAAQPAAAPTSGPGQPDYTAQWKEYFRQQQMYFQQGGTPSSQPQAGQQVI